jgi:hypothetical protein
MKTWFFPAWNGDFRLEESETGCLLIVEKATPGEKKTLDAFAKAAPTKWGLKGLPETIRSTESATFPINFPIKKVGKLMLKFTRPSKAVLTAIRSVDGKVTVAEGFEGAAIETAIEKAEPKAKAVSVSRPTPCCPLCIPGSVERASEVLLSFLTPAEHRLWSQTRAVVAIGGVTGHRYLISHRNSPRAVKQTKICYDLDDRTIMHFHDWSVPPEEEVLAAKLILEKREPWLRNEATMYHRSDLLRFKNPFGGAMDGTQDAALTDAIGDFAKAFAN